MTFDDDHIVLLTPNGRLVQTCKALGLAWPPPDFIDIAGGPFSTPRYRRVRFSSLTDKERAAITRVARGAEYVLVHNMPARKGPGFGKTREVH